MRILVTGAAGKVGTLLRPLLARPDRIVRLTDLTPITDLAPGEEFVPADLNDAAALETATKGVDAVLHLGGQSREHPWADIVQANINGTYALMEAALKEGVRQAVLVGSHHAAGFHTRPITGEDLADYAFPRPDTLYGVSKVVMEALGSLYHDRFGMNVTVIRLGTCNERSGDTRGLATWISPGDLARLVECAMVAPGYHVVWGVSDNARRWWSLGEAQAIGYVSADDSEAHAGPLLAEQGEPDLTDPLHDRAGGMFTLRPLGEPW
ncbi:NAD-dependent epimerase/dehydratase family protein [Nonomuraea typhae]|uniref:NAD-dependent epimerase/dehydratase family protein n=1 Tax=Nonomuraea typhae TaxID=2603600 RepID=UPI0012F795B8|nr:NAD(P)-dependent oxidoreductase [Nonomuraea typhae]